MKKIINITIGSIVFLIEDDAYAVLESYLRDIRAYFEAAHETPDVMDDIEYSIAEKFTGRGKNAQQAINMDDVTAVIAEMGTVKELAGEVSDDEAPTSESEPLSSKRLYRDTDDVIIGGVAAGIARYFGIDPIIIRVLFFVTIFFGGFGVITYLILWIIVPPADTISKKIRMEGGRGTIAELRNFVQSKIDDAPQGVWKQILMFPFTVIKYAFDVIKRILTWFAPILRILIGSAMGVFALLGLIAVSTAFVALFSGSGASEPVITTVISIVDSGVLRWVTFISLYLIIVLPLAWLFLAAISILRRKRTLGWQRTTVMVLLWCLALSIVGGVAITHNERIERAAEAIHQEQSADMIERSYDNLSFDAINIGTSARVTIMQGPETQVVIQGSERLLDVLTVQDTDRILKISRQRHRQDGCFIWCRDVFEPLLITITTPDVRALDFSGSVTGSMESFTTDTLTASFSGSSRFDMDVNVRTLAIDMSGSGRIGLSGSAHDVSLDLSGSARIEAYDLDTQNVTIDSSGSSRVQLAVADTLDVRASGSTNVSYINIGNVTVDKDISGSGSVNEVTREEVAEAGDQEQE